MRLIGYKEIAIWLKFILRRFMNVMSILRKIDEKIFITKAFLEALCRLLRMLTVLYNGMCPTAFDRKWNRMFSLQKVNSIVTELKRNYFALWWAISTSRLVLLNNWVEMLPGRQVSYKLIWTNYKTNYWFWTETFLRR